MIEYTAIASRDGRWWHVRIPGLGSRPNYGIVTRAGNLAGIELMAQKLIALVLDVSTDLVEVVVQYETQRARLAARHVTRDRFDFDRCEYDIEGDQSPDDPGDCAFCLGSEAAEYGLGEGGNPFEEPKIESGAEQRLTHSDHGLWLIGWASSGSRDLNG